MQSSSLDEQPPTSPTAAEEQTPKTALQTPPPSNLRRDGTPQLIPQLVARNLCPIQLAPRLGQCPPQSPKPFLRKVRISFSDLVLRGGFEELEEGDDGGCRGVAGEGDGGGEGGGKLDVSCQGVLVRKRWGGGRRTLLVVVDCDRGRSGESAGGVVDLVD